VAAAADADAAVAAAVAELRRVLRPGGRLLVSVPFGAFEDHGWFRQFGGAELARLVELLEPAHVVLDVFRYAPNGWRRSDPAAAGSVRYRLPTAPAAADKAAAARAVACLVARFPEA
jgi:SAM-dependent methyltransferase